MNKEVKEIFDEHDNADEFHDKNEGFVMFVRSDRYHNGLDNEWMDKVMIFYNELKDSGNLRKARVASGFNFKKAEHYLDMLNKLFILKTGKPFKEFKLNNRKRKRPRCGRVFDGSIYDKSDLEFLESINING